MRKKSTYARKRAHNNLALDTAKRITSFERTIARCTPYAGNTLYDSKEVLLRVHLALDGFINRTVADDDTSSYNDLAFAITEGELRWVDIAGETDNPALPVLFAGGDALLRMRARWKRTGTWGLDGPAIQQLKDAVGMYEDVLLASTPQQMRDVELANHAMLKRLKTDKAMQARLATRMQEATEC